MSWIKIVYIFRLLFRSLLLQTQKWKTMQMHFALPRAYCTYVIVFLNIFCPLYLRDLIMFCPNFFMNIFTFPLQLL